MPETGMSSSEEDLDALKQTVRLQGMLLTVLFAVLVRSGTVTKSQVADELEKAIAFAPSDQAELLAMLQSTLSQLN
jgi:hypothetical protein